MIAWVLFALFFNGNNCGCDKLSWIAAREYHDSLQNLNEYFAPIADSLNVIDSSENHEIRIVVTIVGGRVRLAKVAASSFHSRPMEKVVLERVRKIRIQNRGCVCNAAFNFIVW
jgi:hypothetical protein